MSMSLGKILIEFGADTKEFRTDTKKVKKELKDVKGSAEKTGVGFGSMFGAMLAGQAAFAAITAGFAMVKNAIGASLDAAARAEETQNLFEVSFKSMSGAAEEWATTTADAMGVNDTTLKQMSGTMFMMTEAMGFGKEAAFDMATGFTQLALDTSSLMNLPYEVAFSKIRAGLTGEAEGLKALGIIVNQNTIDQLEFTKKIKATGRALTEQEKVQARGIIIMQGLSNAENDLINTAESWTNKTRSLGEQWVNFQEVLGGAVIPLLSQTLLPIIEEGIHFVTDLVTELDSGEGKLQTFGKMFAWFGDVAVDVLSGVPALFNLITSAIAASDVALGYVGQAIDALNERADDKNSLENQIKGWLKYLDPTLYMMTKIDEKVNQVGKTTEQTVTAFDLWKLDMMSIAKLGGVATPEMISSLEDLMGAGASSSDAMQTLFKNLEKTKKEGEETGESISYVDKHLERLNTVLDNNEGMSEKAAKALAKLEAASRKMTVAGLVDEMDLLNKKLELIPEGGKLTNKALLDMRKKAEELRAEGVELNKELLKIWESFEIGGKNQFKFFQPAKVDLPEIVDLTYEWGNEVDSVVMAQEALGYTGPGSLQAVIEKTDEAEKETMHWRDQLQNVANAFQSMGFAGAKALGQIVGGIATAGAAGEDFKEGLSDIKNNFMNVAAAGMQAFGAIMSATEGVMSTGQRALGGAMAGASFGQAFGPIGAGIGAAVGAAIGLIRGKPEYQKIMEDIGRDWGVTISEELAKQIEATAERLDLGRVEARLLNLGDVIAETGAGGAEGIAKWSVEVGNLMNAVASGAVPAAEGIAEIGESFVLLAEESLKTGDILDQGLIQIIQRSRELGQEIPEIAAFVAQSLADAAAGLAKIGGIQILTPEDAAAQATIVTATFFATMAEQGLLAAADAMRPAWEALKKSLDTAGMDMAIPGMDRLMEIAGEDKFRPLLEGVQGLSEAMTGLSNSGYMTTEAFSAFGQQAGSAFTQLTAAGLTNKEALLQIAPMLQNMQDAAASYGMALDPATQSLIDQAEAAGIAFKTDPMQMMVDILGEVALALGVTKEKIDAISGSGKESFGAAADAAVSAGETTRNAFDQTVDSVTTATDNMKKVSTDTYVEIADAAVTSMEQQKVVMGEGALAMETSMKNFAVAAGDAATSMKKDFISAAKAAARAIDDIDITPGGGGHGGGHGGDDVPGMQHGGIVTSPGLAFLGEGGPEAVIPLPKLRGMMGGRGDGTDAALLAEMRRVRTGLDRLPEIMRIALRDAMMQSGGG